MMQTDCSLAHKCTSRERSERGQALVEFALVLMFIILPLTFVVIDSSLTLFTLSNVTNAAREGARAGSIYQTVTPQGGTQTFASYWAQVDSERLNYIQNYLRSDPYGGSLRNLISFDECTMTITYSPATPAMGNPFRELDSLTVRLECPRRLLFGLVNANTINLTAEATMKIEPGGTCQPDPDDPTTPKCDDGVSP